MGAGHVGRALARLMVQMPVRTVVVDSRHRTVALPRRGEHRESALPEAEIDRAPPGSAFVILTHDHALDFLLVAQALARNDAAYVGMIGSATKRARLARWCRDHCDGQRIDALTCPIGTATQGDKRPEVIAAGVLPEVMAALARACPRPPVPECAMTDRLLRGRLLTFHAEPQGPEDTDAYSYIEDGALLDRGRDDRRAGDYAEIAAQAPDLPVTDHRPHLMMAGFIDPHIHFPQLQVIASWGAQLLDWLNTYTFPEEMRFADPDHAARMAALFLDQLVAQGTTTAAAYCSVHVPSAEALFAEAARRDMRMIAGKVMMDRNAPDGLRDTAQTGYDDSTALIARWHGKGRALYAISPRFAITSTPQQLEIAGALMAEHPGCYLQTHLSETQDEIAVTAGLYPDAPDYLGVYEQYGLLSPRALMGHCLHLSPREIGVMRETGARAVFCPTSNLFLGSGLFDETACARLASPTPSPPMWAAAPALRCCKRWLRATRSFSFRASACTRCAPSTGSRGAMRRHSGSKIASARWRRAAKPISSCSTPARPLRWRCGQSARRRSRKSCSSFRSWATTAPSRRPTSRARRRNRARFQ